MRLRLKRAGLTVEDWDWLLAKQGGVCYLCAKPETRKDAATLSVDYDHVCHPPVAKGQTWACKKCIRALLCHNCNHMIGLAELAGGAVAERFADYLARRPFVEEGR